MVVVVMIVVNGGVVIVDVLTEHKPCFHLI
jgi:hypothetical protein